MRKYVYSCFFIIACFAGIALIGCSGQTTVKLDEPCGFTTDGTYLSWEKVANANHYIVRVNDVEFESENNVFDLRILSSDYNRVQVRAKEHSTSDYVFQQSDYGEVLYIKKLATPQSVSCNPNSIVWGTVEGAKEYKITIENENKAIVYTTTNASTYVKLTEIQEYIFDEGRYYVSVSALAENKSSVENNTFLFTTISSAANRGNVLTVSHKMKMPHCITLNSATQCIEWEASGYSSGCEATIRDNQNNIVYSGKANKYYQKYSIPINDIDTTTLIDGNYTISIKVLKPETAMWIIENNSAIYAIENSDTVDFIINTSFDETLPAVDNIKFYGETSYITSITWSSIGTSMYEVCLLDENSNKLYTERVSANGIYLIDIYNKFVHEIQESGNYTFTVQALSEQSNDLYILNNELVRATKNSEIVAFDFVATIDSKLDAPTNIKISNKYVGGEIQWHEPSGAAGFLITIDDSEGTTVYSGGTRCNLNDNICYFLVDSFKHYLKFSGNYKMRIQSISFINLGWTSTLSKSQDSDIVEFEFYYDNETQQISNI